MADLEVNTFAPQDEAFENLQKNLKKRGRR